MSALILVSFIWAFSFGIIKNYLPGVDSSFVSFVRLLISFLVFLPFLYTARISPRSPSTRLRAGHEGTKGTWGGIKWQDILKYVFIGAIQFGFMYLAYIHSFRYLKAYQVAFFTVFTPLFVTLLDDLLEKRFRALFLAAAGLAVIGTAIIVYQEAPLSDLTAGFWLVQASNLCFAVGQVLYRRFRLPRGAKDRDVFGWMYLGAVLVTLMPAGMASGWTRPSLSAVNWAALFYLGAVASGLGFFLWNVGARKVNAGALAVLNNLKVPLGAFVSILVFRESADWMRVTAGTAIILGALVLNERMSAENPKNRANPPV
jgi:drug/metabolite transporter (DMT)-like permease